METRNGLNSISGVLNNAMKQVNTKQYEKKKNSFKPKFARFKMKVWYKDGNTQVMYGYDFYNQYSNGIKNVITDECLGLSKLKNYITKNNSFIRTAMIFTTIEKEKGTEQSRYDILIYKGVSRNNVFQNDIEIPLKFNLGFIDLFFLQQFMRGGLK